MSTEDNLIPQRIKPLDERILDVMKELPQWDFKLVKKYFPNEHEKGIYRALKKLETDGAIRYLGWQGRTKQYTTRGISNLPTIVTKNGSRIDIKTMFPVIPSEYTEDFVWKRLEKLNNFPMLIGQIFTTAQLSDDEFKTAYLDLLVGFSEYLQELRLMLDQVEGIRNHPIMAGDSALFKSVIQNEMPDQEKLREFKVWITKYVKMRESEKEAMNADF